MTRRATRTAIGLVAALLACASVETPPPGPSPFRAARKIVLVRLVEDPKAPPARDPVDALKETLDARGYETRIVEVGPGKDGSLRDLQRLEERIGAHYANRGRPTTSTERLGPEVGGVVAKLGADAVAGYHRFDARFALPPPPDPFGSQTAGSRMPTTRRPVGAISLVAPDGSAEWFPWGGAGAELESGALINAAEAIDAVLGALGSGGENG